MVYKEVTPSELVKGERYHFSTDGQFDNMTVVGIYHCSRIEWDNEDFNQLFFYPIKGNTKNNSRITIKNLMNKTSDKTNITTIIMFN